MLDTGQGGKHGPISEDINDIYCDFRERWPIAIKVNS